MFVFGLRIESVIFFFNFLIDFFFLGSTWLDGDSAIYILNSCAFRLSHIERNNIYISIYIIYCI